MKRTTVSRQKLRLNAETIRGLQPENLAAVNGGRCMTVNATSTFADGNCTNYCNSDMSCACNTATQCFMTSYC